MKQHIKEYVMPFGKYKGQSLEIICIDDQGLLYLDWLYGDLCKHTKPVLKNILGEFLADPVIAKDLQELIEEKR